MATFTQTPELMKETIGWDGGLAKKLSGGGKTILFVEDEAFVRNVTSEVLRSAGYKVLIARSADEALVAYRESFGTVEFLLTDVILPGESGMTLAGRLRHEDPKLKVLFISGYAEHLGMCNCEGAECLAKPFSTIALLERIKQLFDRRQSWAAEQGPLRRACGNA
jgi:DNA-binding response OmpR family regulator